MPTQCRQDKSVLKYEVRDFSVFDMRDGFWQGGGLHGPDVPLKVASICSSVLPLVSGIKAIVKMTLRTHIEANSQKVPALVRRVWKRSQFYLNVFVNLFTIINT